MMQLLNISGAGAGTASGATPSGALGLALSGAEGAEDGGSGEGQTAGLDFRALLADLADLAAQGDASKPGIAGPSLVLAADAAKAALPTETGLPAPLAQALSQVLTAEGGVDGVTSLEGLTITPADASVLAGLAGRLQDLSAKAQATPDIAPEAAAQLQDVAQKLAALVAAALGGAEGAADSQQPAAQIAVIPTEVPGLTLAEMTPVQTETSDAQLLETPEGVADLTAPEVEAPVETVAVEATPVVDVKTAVQAAAVAGAHVLHDDSAEVPSEAETDLTVKAEGEGQEDQTTDTQSSTDPLAAAFAAPVTVAPETSVTPNMQQGGLSERAQPAPMMQAGPVETGNVDAIGPQSTAKPEVVQTAAESGTFADLAKAAQVGADPVQPLGSLQSGLETRTSAETANVRAATSTPPQPPLPMTDKVWPESFVQSVTRAMAGGQETLSITLTPERLGHVHLRVEVVDGVANLAIVTETPEASRLFVDQQHRLADLMKSAGLELGQQSVNTGAGEGGAKGRDQADGPAGALTGQTDDATDTETEMTTVRPMMLGSRLVDLFA